MRPALSISRATIFCYHRSMKVRSASSSVRSPSTCAKWCLTCTVMRVCPILTRLRAVCWLVERKVQPSKCKRWPMVTGMNPNRAQRTTLPCRAREIAPESTKMDYPMAKWITKWHLFTTSVDQEMIVNWYGTQRVRPRGPANSLKSRDWQVIRMGFTSLGLNL